MNWSNLKENKCPKCGKDFMEGLKTYPNKEGDQILSHPCGFKIREKRYSQIVTGQVVAQLEETDVEE